MRSLLLCVAFSILLISQDLLAQDASATGAALRAMFNVERAPQAKAMGLFQANFLDSIPTIDRPLQLAVVVDSTESMTGEMSEIQKNLPLMFSDLYRIHDGAVTTTLVTYADVGASDRPARVISPTFLDQASAQKLVEQLKVESGRPFFPESVDLGVFTALDQLDWAADGKVDKWMLVIGDAPPYDVAFFDEKTKARRWYDTDFLVDLANKKNLKIHCLLCPSRSNEQAAYEASLDKTRQFMSRLSEGTGGQMLDLSFPAIRQRLVQTGNQPEPRYVRLGAITQQDIDAVRQSAPAASNGAGNLRVAVLPLLPMDSMTFFYDKPAVQLATEIRQALQSLPNVRTVVVRQIEDELDHLRDEGIPQADWPQAALFAVASRLSGDRRLADSRRTSVCDDADLRPRILHSNHSTGVAMRRSENSPRRF